MSTERTPRTVDWLLDRGNEEFDRGRYEEASELFRQATEAGGSWAYLNLGNALQELGDEQGAAKAFSEGAASGDTDAEFNLAQLRSRQGEHEAAREIHRSLMNRGYVKSLDQEAWYVHEDDGDREKGREMMLQAAQSKNTDGDRAAAIYGTWLWEDEADPAAELFLKRGVHTWPEAWGPLLDLRRKASRARRMRGPHPKNPTGSTEV